MRRLALLLAGLIGALVLVGCGGGDDNAVTTAPAEATTEVSWAITDLGTLGGDDSSVVAINERGQVVGESETGAWDKSHWPISHAFLWTNGRVIDLGTLPGTKHSIPTAINADGRIVGYCFEWYDWDFSEEHGQRAVLWENGRMIDLGKAGDENWADAINDRGQVVVNGAGGLWEDGAWTDLELDLASAINERGQVVGENRGTASVWEDGETTDLGTLGERRPLAEGACAVNERGQIVGDSETKSGHDHSFLWEDGEMTDLGTLGGPWSEACSRGYEWKNADAINERGQVVGESATRAKNEDGIPIPHAFLWEDGTMIDLGTLGGTSSEARGINERGQVVGSADTTRRDKDGYLIEHAFVWSDGKMTDLGTLGGERSWAVDINELGQIIGESETKDGDTHAVLWTPHRSTRIQR